MIDESKNLPGGADGSPLRKPVPGMFLRRLLVLAVLVLAGGCASYGVVHNQPALGHTSEKPYALRTWSDARKEADFVFILAFSGGGTRAAAMAYGVLRKLRNTPIVLDGEKARLLDGVTHISSVSGGSFTSAYYGLYGDRIFTDFEHDFLRRDVEKHLTRDLLRPTHWFSRKGRTERAMEYYDKILFHNATFADMLRTDRPMIIINSSDLAHGVRFSFIQDYFEFLCSDLVNFPVATAVTASSAVPVVFNPVVVENYGGCPGYSVSERTLELAKDSDELSETLAGLQSYSDKKRRKYIHFVDGGITDNTGLRAVTDVIQISGGPDAMISKMARKPPRRIVVLTVNASTEQRSDMDEKLTQPSMLASLNAMTDVQLHRYNAATIDVTRQELEAWVQAVSTPEHPVEDYFIEVSFKQVQQGSLRLFLNKIPTSFSLEDKQVDALISSAGEILSADPEFQRLLKDLGSD